jgi:hypothetical protein
LASILQSWPPRKLGFAEASIVRAAEHTLARIGDAFAAVERNRK